MNKILSIRHLTKHFPVGGRSLLGRGRKILHANEDICLDIYEGETFGLVGESGCGKSTLGRTVLQLNRPTSGEVFYYSNEGEIDLAKCKGSRLRALRRELQIIFQDPYSSLNPRMTAGQLIAEGVATHGIYPRKSNEMEGFVLQMMEKCGLQRYMAGRYPHQFSGGQRQRICIARALAVRPRFVVCDECVSALDVSIQSQILNLLRQLKEEEGLTYLFISHDLSVVRYLSDRIGVMYLGRIVELGSAREVFETPCHPYTKALISAIPGEESGQARIVLKGNIPSAISPPAGCPFHPRCFMAQECCQRIPAPLKEVTKGHFSACHFAENLLKKQ